MRTTRRRTNNSRKKSTLIKVGDQDIKTFFNIIIYCLYVRRKQTEEVRSLATPKTFLVSIQTDHVNPGGFTIHVLRRSWVLFEKFCNCFEGRRNVCSVHGTGLEERNTKVIRESLKTLKKMFHLLFDSESRQLPLTLKFSQNLWAVLGRITTKFSLNIWIQVTRDDSLFG